MGRVHGKHIEQTCANASLSTSAKAVAKLATPAGSFTASSTASNLMARCHPTKPLEVVTIPSTPFSPRQALASTLFVKYMDIDGDGNLTEAEVVKFHSLLYDDEEATAEDLGNGIKSFVGITAEEAKARFKELCSTEEKLDFMISKYEEDAHKRVEEKINTIVDKYMDIDGDGNLTEAEVVKFEQILSGNEEATAEDLDEGMKSFVGLTAAEAKAKIQEMCGGAEEKLDFSLSKYEEIAQKRIEEKISTLVDKYMDIDGDGNLTEAEVVKFEQILSDNKEATAEDLDKDMKVLVGLTAAEAKAKIQEMCGGAEEKLDFILSKYE